MSNPSVLEKSLNEIIGSDEARSHRNPNPRKSRGGRERNRIGKGDRPRRDRTSLIIPPDVTSKAHGKPVLRVKNVHRELTGEDLKNLFEQVGGVDFITFDKHNDSIAYVLFLNDHARNNLKAVAKFDGRKAMGRTIVVESSSSLADRINLPSRNNQQRLNVRERVQDQQEHSAKKNKKNNKAKERPVKEKQVKKSVQELDDELSAYMSGEATSAAAVESGQAEAPASVQEGSGEMEI